MLLKEIPRQLLITLSHLQNTISCNKNPFFVTFLFAFFFFNFKKKEDIANKMKGMPLPLYEGGMSFTHFGKARFMGI